MPKRNADQPPLTFSLFKPSKVVPGPRIEKMSQTKAIRRAMRSSTTSTSLPKAPPSRYVGKLADAERAWRDRYPGDVAGKEN